MGTLVSASGRWGEARAACRVTGRTAGAETSPHALLQSSARFPEGSLAWRVEFILRLEIQKSQHLSLRAVSHQTHFHPRNNTHIVWKKNKLRGTFSRLSKKIYCSYTCLSLSLGNSGGSKASPCVLSQPGSDMMLQRIIIFFVNKINSMVVQFEKPPFSSHS